MYHDRNRISKIDSFAMNFDVRGTTKLWCRKIFFWDLEKNFGLGKLDLVKKKKF